MARLKEQYVNEIAPALNSIFRVILLPERVYNIDNAFVRHLSFCMGLYHFALRPYGGDIMKRYRIRIHPYVRIIAEIVSPCHILAGAILTGHVEFVQ